MAPNHWSAATDQDQPGAGEDLIGTGEVEYLDLVEDQDANPGRNHGDASRRPVH
jgi:hypothetical protein